MTKQPTAYEMFQSGYDTMMIARHFGISEAAAHKALTLQRCAARNLTEPYEVKALSWPKGRVAYAGR